MKDPQQKIPSHEKQRPTNISAAYLVKSPMRPAIRAFKIKTVEQVCLRTRDFLHGFGCSALRKNGITIANITSSKAKKTKYILSSILVSPRIKDYLFLFSQGCFFI